jgi:oligosaccharide repeat unit polymerase
MTRIFLHPIFLFCCAWFFMLAGYLVSPSVFYLHSIAAYFTLFELFLVSATFYLLSFHVAKYFLSREPGLPIARKQVQDVEKKRILAIFLLLGLALFVMILNAYLEGLPPLILKLMHDASKYTYTNYGHLKNLLYSACYLIVMLSMVLSSRWARYFFVACALAILTLYLSRGPFMFIVLQVVIYALLKMKHITFKRLLYCAIGMVLFACIMMEVLGAIRTGHHAFLLAMQVKPHFQHWPAGLLWVMIYFSAPIVNVISFILNGFSQFHHGLLNLSIILPPLLGSHVFPLSHHVSSQYYIGRQNTAFSYLGTYYLDFGWWGVALVNVLYGVCGAWFYARYRQGQEGVRNWYYAIYLSFLLLIGLYPFLLGFPSFLEFGFVWLIAMLVPGIFER